MLMLTGVESVTVKNNDFSLCWEKNKSNKNSAQAVII